MNILKNKYPIRTVSNKKLKYPAGINRAKLSSDFIAGISSSHNDAKIEAWNRKSTPINNSQAKTIEVIFLFSVIWLLSCIFLWVGVSGMS